MKLFPAKASQKNTLRGKLPRASGTRRAKRVHFGHVQTTHGSIRSIAFNRGMFATSIYGFFASFVCRVRGTSDHATAKSRSMQGGLGGFLALSLSSRLGMKYLFVELECLHVVRFLGWCISLVIACGTVEETAEEKVRLSDCRITNVG